MSHTPTPWRYVRQNPSPTTGEHMIAGAKPGYLAEVRDCGSGEVSANAEFIVRACNSHDALVAALKSVLAQANNIEVLGEWSVQDINHSAQKRVRAQVNAIYADARAALAAAEAK